jgi:hypothetical protein
VAAAGAAVLVVPTDGFSRPVFAALALIYAATAAGYGFARRADLRRARQEHPDEPEVGRPALV